MTHPPLTPDFDPTPPCPLAPLPAFLARAVINLPSFRPRAGGEVGDTNNEDDFVDGSVIPDAIGIWDIQVRLNDLKRRGGAAAAPANGTSVVKGRRSTRTDQVFSGQKRARNVRVLKEMKNNNITPFGQGLINRIITRIAT